MAHVIKSTIVELKLRRHLIGQRELVMLGNCSVIVVLLYAEFMIAGNDSTRAENLIPVTGSINSYQCITESRKCLQ